MDKPLTTMPDMPGMPKTNTDDNPLKKYYRQAAIYITLPSKGKYYTKENFTPTETGEIPILPMTAKDEMTLKTPDALINGQATVDVIESCVPNVKNAWAVVNHDLDVLLLAIRIATYGETMNLSGTVPGTSETVEHTVNLPAMLEDVGKIDITDEFKTSNGFHVKVRPMAYKELTDTQVSAFEKQKQYVAMTSRTDINDVEKGRLFAENFKQLTEMNFDILNKAIVEIRTPENAVVTDKAQITEFLANTPKQIVEEIQKGLAANRNQASIKPIKLKATEEQIKKGAPASYEMPITFDSANFFV
jgi:hypothetical protein